MNELELLSEVAVLKNIPEKGLVRARLELSLNCLPLPWPRSSSVDDQGRTYAMTALQSEELIRLHHRPYERVA